MRPYVETSKEHYRARSAAFAVFTLPMVQSSRRRIARLSLRSTLGDILKLVYNDFFKQLVLVLLSTRSAIFLCLLCVVVIPISVACYSSDLRHPRSETVVSSSAAEPIEAATVDGLSHTRVIRLLRGRHFTITVYSGPHGDLVTEFVSIENGLSQDYFVSLPLKAGVARRQEVSVASNGAALKANLVHQGFRRISSSLIIQSISPSISVERLAAPTTGACDWPFFPSLKVQRQERDVSLGFLEIQPKPISFVPAHLSCGGRPLYAELTIKAYPIWPTLVDTGEGTLLIALPFASAAIWTSTSDLFKAASTPGLLQKVAGAAGLVSLDVQVADQALRDVQSGNISAQNAALLIESKYQFSRGVK